MSNQMKVAAIYVLRENSEVDLWVHALNIGVENELS